MWLNNKLDPLVFQCAFIPLTQTNSHAFLAFHTPFSAHGTERFGTTPLVSDLEQRS